MTERPYYENQMEMALILNIGRVFDGAVLVSRQYPVTSGRIDLLCRSKCGELMIIECKSVISFPDNVKVKLLDSAIGQLYRYAADIRRDSPKHADATIQLIILTDEEVPSIVRAAKETGLVEYVCPENNPELLELLYLLAIGHLDIPRTIADAKRKAEEQGMNIDYELVAKCRKELDIFRERIIGGKYE